MDISTMSPEIAAAVGVLASGLVSFLVAKSQTKAEIKKLKLSWEHEDIVSSDEDFAAMAHSVGDYVTSAKLGLYDDAREAAAKVAGLRVNETGDLGNALDELYRALQEGGYDAVDASLSKVVEAKRKRRRQPG